MTDFKIGYFINSNICLLFGFLDIFAKFNDCSWWEYFKGHTFTTHSLLLVTPSTKFIFHSNFFLLQGIAGLAVTYGLNLNAVQTKAILFLCNLENKIISVERMLQYMHIPLLVIKDNQPDYSWPSFGEVHIQDLEVHFKDYSFVALWIKGYSYIFLLQVYPGFYRAYIPNEEVCDAGSICSSLAYCFSSYFCC